MKKQDKPKFAGETLEEAIARTEKLDNEIKANPDYQRYAADFDREYEVTLIMEKARKRAKLTQAQVAERMGTTQSAVARMAKKNISIDALARYLKACGATLKISACF